MFYREIIAVCSQIHKKHINTLCGQNLEFVNVKLVVPLIWIMYKQPVPRSKHTPSRLYIQTSQLMVYREIISVCSEIHTKHINTLCWQNVELLNVKLMVHIVTTDLNYV